MCDRISSLPDELLHHIISFLPSLKYAAQTSILSNRWRYLWTFNPNLIYTLRTAERTKKEEYVRNVDQCLQAYKSQQLGTVKLTIFLSECRPPICPNPEQWIAFAVERSVQNLTLFVFFPPYQVSYLKMPDLFFRRGGSLKSLELTNSEFFLPKDFQGFGSLEKLTLRICLLNEESIPMILEKCPLLEILHLDECLFNYISYISLKNYVMIPAPNRVEISAPNLQVLKLNLGSFKVIRLHLTNAPQLRKVCLFATNLWLDFRKFKKALASVEILEVSAPFLKFVFAEYYLYESTLEMFENLKYFRVLLPLPQMISKPHLLSLVRFFRDCHSLEKISIWCGVGPVGFNTMGPPPEFSAILEDGKPSNNFDAEEEFRRVNGDQQLERLDYLLFSLKTVTIFNFFGDENQMVLIKFILKNAVFLKLLKLIVASKEKGRRLREQLFLLPRYSFNARIVISSK